MGSTLSLAEGPDPAAALRRRRVAALAAALLLAAALRLWGLGAQPLWFDEAFSVWFSDQSLDYLWGEAPRFELHPPFYYTLLKFWRGLAGSGEAALRLPSALASLAAVAAIHAAGRAAGGPARGWALGLTAAVLAACWRLQIEFAQDARMYAFGAAGAALTLAGAVALVRRPDLAATPLARLPGAAPWTAAALAAVGGGMALTLWSHNLGAVPVGLTGGFLAVWWALGCGADRRVFWNLAAAALLAAALYAPNLPILIAQTRTLAAGFWLVAPASLGELAQLSLAAYAQPVVGVLGLRGAAAATALLILAGLVGLARAADGPGRTGWWVAGLALTLTAGPWLVLTAMTYAGSPVLLPRTLAFAQPALLLVLAAAPWAAPARLRPWAAAALMAAVAAFAGRPSGSFALDRPYPAVIAALSAEPDAPLIVAPGALEAPLAYYAARAGVALAPIHFGRSMLGAPAAGSVAGSAAEAAAAVGDAPAVWLVHRRLDLVDPDGLLRAQLRAAGFCEAPWIGDEGADVRLSRFTRPACPGAAPR